MTDGVWSQAGSTGGYVDALTDDDPTELYETAPCGYVSLSASGLIIKCNRTFSTWTGHAAADLVRVRHFQQLLPAGDRIYYETHLAPSLSMQGAAREVALELLCAGGVRLPVLINAVRTTTEDGSAVIRLAVFDARERRSYERELLDERRRAEEAAERARAMAETLQRTLLPPTTPQVPGMCVGGAFRPAGDGSVVGGDFYDIFELRDHLWGVVLGDVCGKGTEAAVVTAVARYSARAFAMRSLRPSDVLRGVDEAIAQSGVGGFCTALFVTVEVANDRALLRMSAGGHHLPLHVGADGTVMPMGRTGGLLGILGPPRLHEDDVVLMPGESLVLFTDGVIEGRAGDDFFGEQRLHELLARSAGDDAQALADAVASSAVDFQEGSPRDDIAVVVLQFCGDEVSA